MSFHPYFALIPLCFLLGLAAGFIMHRSDFCLAGMFRDFCLFRRTDMLRSLLLLVTVSMLLFEFGRLSGLLTHYPFPLLGSPSLTNLLGGAVFGLGMVVAGGCVVGTLYKLGAGSLLSLGTFFGLIVGSLCYAEFSPWWASVAKATSIFQGKTTLPQYFNISPLYPVLLLSAVSGWLLLGWFREGKMHRPAFAEGYLQPWLAAIALALLGFVSWLSIGMPFGITTAYAKLGAFVELALFPQHLAGLPYFGSEPLQYVPPLGGVTVRGGAGPRLDAVAAVQFPLILGIVLGSALSAKLLGEFRIVRRLPARQLVAAVSGGVIMGVAARMAPACNVWHLLGGLPILAGQSLLFCLGLWPGAWLGSRILTSVVFTDEA